MTSSGPLPPAALPRGADPRTVWTFQAPAAPRGLALAREKGTTLVWDEQHALYLLNRRGERQAQARAPAALAAACAAADGSALAAVGRGGEVWWLAPDLAPRWQRSLPHPAVAAALDPFGQYLAVSAAGGLFALFDRHGRAVARAETPRPLHRICFVPEAPLLAGCADFGLVACFDPGLRCLWRDAPVAHAGTLAASGDGGLLVLACYSDGLRAYAASGRRLGRLGPAEPCHLADVSYDGRRVLAADLAGRLRGLDGGGRPLGSLPLDRPAAGLALGPLGHDAVVALADGRVLGLDVRAWLGL